MDKGKGKAVDKSWPSDLDNTSDSSSSTASSVFDIPKQLKPNNISMNRGRRAGAPSNQPFLDDEASSTHSFTHSEHEAWLDVSSTRDNTTRRLLRGDRIEGYGILPALRRRNSDAGFTGNPAIHEGPIRRGLSEGWRTGDRRGLAELNLQAERVLKLSTKESHKIIRETWDQGPTALQLSDPNYVLALPPFIPLSDSDDSENRSPVHSSNGGSPGGPGGTNSGGGSPGPGSTGGNLGSGTVHFILENLYELTIIFPCLLGILSTILAINPETLMYFRLIITLIREPAFKLYMYFKFLDLLCFINNMKHIFCLFCIYLFTLVKTIIFHIIYFTISILTKWVSPVSNEYYPSC